jgi:uncharacterized membrane protein
MQITSERDIAASVDRVWQLTIDIERWPTLTPTVTSVERLDDGPLHVGSAARVVQPRQRPTVWTVTTFDEGKVFEWKAKMLSVTMTGTHRLEATADGCHNTLMIGLSGFGSSVLGRMVGRQIKTAIDTENDGFKKAAETAA